MRLDHDAETEAFRAEFLDWVDANLPSASEMAEPILSTAHLPAWAAAWQRTMFDAGWLMPGWPPRYGGRDATPLQQLVYHEAVAQRQVPRGYNPQGLSIISPSIIERGTPEQIEQFAIPCLRGELTFGLGMSEPDAGSDLASLRTRAVRQGDTFVVNGQKVWTSGAQHAEWCFTFVRTDPDVVKHAGITVLLIDMATPGISVRPLAELTDPDHVDFNEVFFDDVHVPVANIVGELNGGWSIATSSLAHERGMLWVSSTTGLERELSRLIEWARRPLPDGRVLAEDAVFRSNVARVHMQVQAMKAMGYAGFAKSAKGVDAPEQSLLKLYGSEIAQRLAAEVTAALGAFGLDLDAGPTTIDGSAGASWAHSTTGVAWPDRWLRSFAGTIAGGTSEVQRNIVAERVMGLPRR
ncbi:MAG: acyl-CoA dehydrogenase family protein [Actinomycetota bacterium]|nr:acyl-CoA dehydrogenase family protein [Actinomycetota bacterium]